MTKQQKTALNMAKFIQNQSLLLLEKLNELDLDVEADLCEKLHDERSIFSVHLSLIHI
ncbi:Rop family plasmid primer RNA-binding protein, partial [Klebsiella pneumoniae]|uniref:Rop family plasmid primer RNA-binding protein n=1 Tax=Klebsiella pneumoniae TaxID=573 RepID=UPI00094361A2